MPGSGERSCPSRSRCSPRTSARAGRFARLSPTRPATFPSPPRAGAAGGGASIVSAPRPRRRSPRSATAPTWRTCGAAGRDARPYRRRPRLLLDRMADVLRAREELRRAAAVATAQARATGRMVTAMPAFGLAALWLPDRPGFGLVVGSPLGWVALLGPRACGRSGTCSSPDRSGRAVSGWSSSSPALLFGAEAVRAYRREPRVGRRSGRRPVLATMAQLGRRPASRLPGGARTPARSNLLLRRAGVRSTRTMWWRLAWRRRPRSAGSASWVRPSSVERLGSPSVPCFWPSAASTLTSGCGRQRLGGPPGSSERPRPCSSSSPPPSRRAFRSTRDRRSGACVRRRVGRGARAIARLDGSRAAARRGVPRPERADGRADVSRRSGWRSG